MHRTLRNRAVLPLTLVTLFVAACATITPDLPSITEGATNHRHVGKVIWRDLLTSTPAESRKFYGELFGWTFEKPGIELGFGDTDSYMLIRHEGELIGGMLDINVLGKDANVSQWMSVFSTDDVEAAVAGLTQDGGKVLTPPKELQTRGTIAVIEDPTGAVFAVLQARDGDPDDAEPVINGFLWNELWTNDVPAAGSFYTSLFNFDIAAHDIDDSQRTYHVFESNGTPRAGLMANPFEEMQPVWVSYLRVQNPVDITTKVAGLGGEVLVEPQPRDIGGVVALVAGPSGAGIALQTWPIRQGDAE